MIRSSGPEFREKVAGFPMQFDDRARRCPITFFEIVTRLAHVVLYEPFDGRRTERFRKAARL